MINFSREEIRLCFEFAQNMRGRQRPNFQNGTERNELDIFINTLQGKLGEIAVYNYIQQRMPTSIINGQLDFNIMNRGQWDNYDLQINNKVLNIKSVKHFSEVLLIECSRFDQFGNYAYLNHDGTPIRNDYYVLVRIEIEPQIRWQDYRGNTENFLNNKFVVGEVSGGISHPAFWETKTFIPNGTMINRANMRELLLNRLPVQNLQNNRAGKPLQVDNFGIHMNLLTPLERLEI
ncbi:hypothetical protein ACOSZH_25235 [Priestia megaterium]|uniref:hypothetical protein n=1 Tax=Priestia megaterium TaxID=1404 RepID=UPI003B9DEA01